MNSEKAKIEINIDINDFIENDEEEKKILQNENIEPDADKKRKTVFNSLSKSLDKSKCQLFFRKK